MKKLPLLLLYISLTAQACHTPDNTPTADISDDWKEIIDAVVNNTPLNTPTPGQTIDAAQRAENVRTYWTNQARVVTRSGNPQKIEALKKKLAIKATIQRIF